MGGKPFIGPGVGFGAAAARARRAPPRATQRRRGSAPGAHARPPPPPPGFGTGCGFGIGWGFGGGSVGFAGLGAGGGCGVGLGLGWGYGAAWGSKYIIIEPEFESKKPGGRPRWLAQLQQQLRIQKFEHAQRHVRLDWRLRAHRCIHGRSVDVDDEFWSDAGVRKLLLQTDVYGLGLVFMNLLGASWTAGARPQLALGPWRPISLLLLVLAMAQLVLMQRRGAWFAARRQHVALANRLLRIALALRPAVLRSFDVMAVWIDPEHSAAAHLAANVLAPPLMNLQVALSFSLPFTTAMLMQPLHVALAAAWNWNAPLSAAGVPGLQDLARRVCGAARGAGVFALYMLDEAAMPGVPGAHLPDGLPDVCADGRSAYVQLLLFSNLLLCAAAPLALSYAIERRHKTNFWRARGAAVRVDRSPLNPLPGCAWLSTALVAAATPLALWFASEALSPHWRPLELR
ncbi:hypothetical protein HT031_000113 [Scenedesmus sp. PABB004]|nr:hypothetical protein HT031_000113 [Scenedesmus sp. PABB004]